MNTIGFHNNEQIFKIGWKAGAYMCKRKEFDSFLMNAVKNGTNTKIIEGLKVNYFKRNSESIIVGNNEKGACFETKLLIGSDGAQSFIAKNNVSKRQKKETSVALRSYVTDVNNIKQDTNEIYTHKDYVPGYFWIFPLSDNTANIGFGTTKNNIRKNKLNLIKCMNDMIKDSDIISSKIANSKFDKIYAGIIPVRTTKYPVSGNRYLLTGDAALLADPISGGGIENAILSGIIAAKNAKEAFLANNFTSSYLKKYDKELLKKIGINYCFRSSFIKLCARHPDIFTLTIRLTRLLNINKIISTRF